MNIVWTVVTVLSLAVLTFTNPQGVLTVCLDSSAQALTTALGLCGVYCLWLGIFEVADRCKLVEGLSRCFARLNKWLYGNIEQVASDYISLNLASNLLGVGNAATPSAISAIKVMEKEEKLSRSGTMLFVINATSVQLIPTTVIGLRASMGSVNPSDILLPNLLSTIVTSIVGVALVFLAYGKPKSTTIVQQNNNLLYTDSTCEAK
ncbi:MAG: ABC transporter permease [Clostridiales bacterium]|nr:ABC transporter permease [Clostridiales bacterium]